MSTKTDRAREDARHIDGTFGFQPHAEAEASLGWTGPTKVKGTWIFPEVSDIDPDNQIGLTDAEQEALRDIVHTRFIDEFDKLIEPYGCTSQGNGVIVGFADGPDLPEPGSEEWRELKMLADEIDFNDIMGSLIPPSDTFVAKDCETGNQVRIKANVPYGRSNRAADTMNELEGNTLIYSPKTGYVATAAEAVLDARDIGVRLQDSGFDWDGLDEGEQDKLVNDPEAIVPFLKREAWEAIFGDPNITIAESAPFAPPPITH